MVVARTPKNYLTFLHADWKKFYHDESNEWTGEYQIAATAPAYVFYGDKDVTCIKAPNLPKIIVTEIK